MKHIVIGSCDRKGQDCSAQFVNEVAGLCGVVLADGMGSCRKAKETAQFIVRVACEELEALQERKALDLPKLFLDVHQKLLSWIADEGSSQPEFGVAPQEYGSTLIVTIDAGDRFVMGYVGNGAIWHIRGNAFANHGNRLLPWSITNLLNPHTIPENGVEALYKYFSGSRNADLVRPTVVELSKDMIHGDVLFSCTDGISSNDQIGIGKVTNGVWVNVEDALLALMGLLRNYLDAPPDASGLERLRDDFVATLDRNAFVEDDASFGIVIGLPNKHLP
jgi:PPM family protein phosphatase